MYINAFLCNTFITNLKLYFRLQVTDDADLVFDDMPMTVDRESETRVLGKRKRGVDDHFEDASDAEDFLVNSLRGDQELLSRHERMAVEEAEDAQDVEDVLNDDSHWLWGSVRRIRRGLDQLMGSDVPSVAAAQQSVEPKKARKLKKTITKNKLHKDKKHGKQAQNSEEHKLNRSRKADLMNRPLIGRPKRQQDDEYADSDDDDNEVGSGDIGGEKLCK